MSRDRDAAVFAAGAVLWRPAPGARPGASAPGTEIALVHRPRYDDWSLPKGKRNPGETDPAAAVREVAEETGFASVLGARLGETRYRVPDGEKVVRYWSARAGAGKFTPNDEVDQLRWVAPDGAGELLTWDRDQEIVDRFRKSPPSRSLLLVRHAKAGNRAAWDGEDDLRPLTHGGRRQAGQLNELLGLFGPERAYAAPPLRCGQTIRPLVQRLGLALSAEPLFGENDYWHAPDAALARLRQIAADPAIPLICSQGGVIPNLVERLTGRSDAPARKASTWVLALSGGRVVSADYYPKPGP